MPDPTSLSPTPKRPRLHTRPPTQPSRSALRVTDLVGTSASRAALALGDSAPHDAWSSLAATINNLPSASQPADSIPDTALVAADNESFPPSTQLRADLDGSHRTAIFSHVALKHLPCDHGLKTRLRVSSPTSLGWSVLRSQREEYIALRAVLAQDDPLLPCSASSTNDPTSFSSTTSRASAQQLFFRRLLHFRFPTVPLSTMLSSKWATLFGGPRARARHDFSKEVVREEAELRLKQWHSALQSVYAGFRSGFIPLFYVLLPKAVVLFHRIDEKRDGDVRASMTGTTAGVRALLAEFVVPFATAGGGNNNGNGNGTGNGDDDGDGDDGDIDAKGDAKDIKVNSEEMHVDDNGSLIVDGQVGVHALYNFISCAAHTLSGARDVPTVVCDAPFREGVATAAEVQLARTARTADGATVHSMAVTGLLTPRQVTGLCHALGVTQRRHFVAAVETESRSRGVDVAVTALRNTRGGVDGENGVNGTRRRRNDERMGVLTKVAMFPDGGGLCANFDAGRGRGKRRSALPT